MSPEKSHVNVNVRNPTPAHTPLTHWYPDAQLLPHLPQLLEDVLVSTHPPVHLVCPTGQAQVPPEATVPVGQDWTHTPPLHSPETQVLPAVHACPSTLRQAPLTACVPVGQRHVLEVGFQTEPEGD